MRRIRFKRDFEMEVNGKLRHFEAGMKKLILIILLLFIPSLLFAQQQEARMSIPMVGGGVVAAGGGEVEETIAGANVFSATWTGSDAQNTDGGAGHVWDGITDTGSDLTKGETAGGGLGGSDNYFLATIPAGENPEARVNAHITSDSIGIRIGLYIDSLGDGATTNIITIRNDTGFATLGSIDMSRATNYYVGCHANDTGSTTRAVGSNIQVSAGEWIQIRYIFQKNTQGDNAGAGASCRVDNAAGQVGSTQNLSSDYTTIDSGSDHIYMGANANGYAAHTYRVDGLVFTNSFAFPDLYSWVNP